MKHPAFSRHAMLAVASVAFLAGASPALAQGDSTDDEKVNQLIVYGDDPCPPSVGDEITVCARMDESERYRIPEILRDVQSPQNEAWNQRVLAYETTGAFGTMSCSPSGYGGWTGCTQQLIEAAYQERAGSSDVRFSELIQAERERRLATIDAAAAAEQERVEQIEREYEARLAAEREELLPGEEDMPPLLEGE